MKIDNMETYSIKPPKYFHGQQVKFFLHNGAIRFGIISFVETHYTKPYNSDVHEAYHIYAVDADGYQTSRWIGEEKIIRGYK